MKKLTIKSKVLDGIPLNEYYLEDFTYKGLVFVQHGYTSNKDYGADFLALTLTRQGYFVLAIDAFKHGERIEEPYLSKDQKQMLFESPIVVRKTAIDIIKLHRKYYVDRFPKYDFIGVSMGGMIAYYLSTKTDKIKKLVPVIGTPDFIEKAKHELAKSGFVFNEDMMNYINKMSPINKVYKMKYEEMFILCGKHDDVVPMEPTNTFYELYGNERMMFKVYDESHNVNRMMQEDIFGFINK